MYEKEREAGSKIKDLMDIELKKVWLTYPTFKIFNLDIEEREVGSSSRWLLNKLSISRLDRFAIDAGRAGKERMRMFNVSM